MRRVIYTFDNGINKTECKKKCKLDSTSTYCIGCYRTIEEIIKKGQQTNGKDNRRGFT